ncbi:LysR family transcriptional regulator [Streptomyces sp. NPDC004542]|uniref:LysR family transcriptional regulator n=1 Tax=Streptomyces sp. NPDC004542 TaxID=3154281 RepID=UPI0033A6DA8F
MELRQLKYFVALADTGNFARAAEREHITQSALSQQISRLERELGLVLFERTSRGTRLTEAGTVLLAHVRAVLAETERLKGEARSLAGGQRGLLRVGSPTYAVSSAGRKGVMAAVARELPGVEIRFENAWSPQLFQRLRDGEVDVTFAMLGAEEPELEIFVVQDSPARLVVPAGHPLADLPVVSAADLRGTRVLLYPHSLNAWMFDTMSLPLSRVGAELEGVRETTLPAVLEQVRQGGDAVFPAVAWEVHLLHPDTLAGLVVLPTTGEPGLRYSLWLARRRADTSPLVQEFWRIARKAVAAQGPGGYQE